MLILKRQDVDISNVTHPKRDQQIPILNYQGQTFRLMSVFSAEQEEEARTFWRDLTDNQGKFCVLLEETERFSIWGRIRLDQMGSDDDPGSDFTVACLLLLQTVYFDVEDLLGGRQAKKFEEDMEKVFKQWHFPKTENAAAIKALFEGDPIDNSAIVPPWEEHHLITLLQELHRIGKEYFGNTTFAEGTREILVDLPGEKQQKFLQWLNQSPLGKLWR